MDQDNEQKPTNLDLTYLVPTVTTDGNSIFINTNDDTPTLTFFQVRRQDGDNLRADAVASVRFASLKELRNLQHNIEDAISNHEKREK
jgi:hypothetical protein